MLQAERSQQPRQQGGAFAPAVVRAGRDVQRAPPQPIAAALVAQLPPVPASAVQLAGGSRAYAIDPVPALTRIPGPVPNAVARATSPSASTRTCRATPASINAASSSACSFARPAPAAPTTARSTGSSRPPWAAARRAVSASTVADLAAPPGRMAAPGPSARPRIFLVEPITTVEWDPPASAPRKTADGDVMPPGRCVRPSPCPPVPQVRTAFPPPPSLPSPAARTTATPDPGASARAP